VDVVVVVVVEATAGVEFPPNNHARDAEVREAGVHTTGVHRGFTER
jgi:hypothetical protein